MRHFVPILALLAATFAPAPLLAQSTGGKSEVAEVPAVPEPPEIPNQLSSGEAIEPEVIIRRTATETITEYRVNGILRAVKVENKDTPAYWLVDTDGDGRLDARQNRWAEKMVIPQWVLFSW